jgi:Na+-driven multidrug efflux pump
MSMLFLVCQFEAERMVRFFTSDTALISIAAGFLHIISWNFMATGLIFTCSSMFQALGNTMPSVISSATRMITFAIPAVWLSTRPGFQIRHIWLLSVATVMIQVVVSLLLLRREFRRRLGPSAPVMSPAPASA